MNENKRGRVPRLFIFNAPQVTESWRLQMKLKEINKNQIL
jgi:hypothetical protein